MTPKTVIVTYAKSLGVGLAIWAGWAATMTYWGWL
jgi:hypothetical protein